MEQTINRMLFDGGRKPAFSFQKIGIAPFWFSLLNKVYNRSPSKKTWITNLVYTTRGQWLLDQCYCRHEYDSLLSGGRFWKDQVTYRARKAILETRSPWKATLLICFRYKERPNFCQVSKLEICSYGRYERIHVTRKVSGHFRNGPQALPLKLSAVENIGTLWPVSKLFTTPLYFDCASLVCLQATIISLSISWWCVLQ